MAPWSGVKQKASRVKWLYSKIPKVSYGIIYFITNIFLPGIGTLLAAYFGKKQTRQFNIYVGILQFLTAPLLIGWLWSIVWGYLIWKRNSGILGKIPNYH